MSSVAGATVHPLAGHHPAHRTGANTLSAADITAILERLASIETKLDERGTATAERLGVLTADIATAAERQREDKRALWAAIEELRSRPQGLTGRTLLATLGAAVALAVGLVELLSRVHLS